MCMSDNRRPAPVALYDRARFWMHIHHLLLELQRRVCTGANVAGCEVREHLSHRGGSGPARSGGAECWRSWCSARVPPSTRAPWSLPAPQARFRYKVPRRIRALVAVSRNATGKLLQRAPRDARAGDCGASVEVKTTIGGHCLAPASRLPTAEHCRVCNGVPGWSYPAPVRCYAGSVSQPRPARMASMASWARQPS